MTSLPQPSRIGVLQFVAVLGMGGTERQVVNLVRTLDSSKFALHVGCLTRMGHFVKEVEALGLPLTEYKINRLYNPRAVREQLRLARYIRRQRIQIVHAYGFYANVFALPAARLAGVPVAVASIRDHGDLWTPMQRRVQRFVCRLADSVLTNAESVRQSLIAERYNPTKIEVIPNGVDLPCFAAPAGGQVREELGFPPHAPLVALVSRLNRLKGVEYFLEAAAIVARRFPEARFLVVGTAASVVNGAIVANSRYPKELEEYAVRLGLGSRIVFAGLRVDTPKVLSEVSVSVLPSLSEGLSNVLLESMAAGVPVVATRVGGNPEVVEDGVSGLLVPPADSATLAEAIGRILADRALASRLADAGRRHIAAEFSLDRMTRATEGLYLHLLREARSASGRRRRAPAEENLAALRRRRFTFRSTKETRHAGEQA